MSDWQELDDLTAELRAANTAWAERVDALAGEGEPLSKLTADVARQFDELGVREALEALAQRALAGAATTYEARRPFGYTRSVTLAWHPADDPRAELATGERDALLTIDVAVGPRLLLGAGDGVPADDRLAVLIMGEKRVMATLPTSRERFRAALLRAFATPRRGAVPPDAREGAGDVGGSAEPTASAPPTDDSEMAGPRDAESRTSSEGSGADRAAEGDATAPHEGLQNAESASSAHPDGVANENAEPVAGEPRAADEPASEAVGRSGQEQRPFKEPPDVIEL